MKNTAFYTIVLLCAALLFSVASCKKGDTGPAGQNGSTILSGNGAPAAAIGKDGDFYLDLAAMLLYGPKTNAGWGSGVLLKGNANVTVDTFTIKQTDWLYSAVYWFDTSPGSSQGYVAKYYDHNQALLTPELINTGIVTVSGVTSLGLSPTTYTTLPFSFTENFSGNYSYNYAYNSTAGKLRVYFFFVKVNGVAPTLMTYTPPPIRIKLAMVSGTVVQNVQRVIQQRSGARFGE